jgi:hypothetical protein
MKQQQQKLDSQLIEKISILRNIPGREPDTAMKGRLAFLQEVQHLSPAPVSEPAPRRHIGWKQKIQSIFVHSRKERSPLFTAIATFLVITTLVLGGGGVTVAAAQSSLPEQPLYDVKLWSEDLRMSLTNDPTLEEQLSQEFLDERFEEVVTLIEDGAIPSEPVLIELQNQMEESIRLALNLPADQAVQALLEIKTRLETQEQTMLKLQAENPSTASAAMLQTREMIQNRIQLLDGDLLEPLQLREQQQSTESLQEKDHQYASTPDGTTLQQPQSTGSANPLAGESNKPGEDNSSGVCETCTPEASGPNGNQGGSGTSQPANENVNPSPTMIHTPVPVLNAGTNPQQGQQGQVYQPTTTNQNQGSDSGSNGSGGKH